MINKHRCFLLLILLFFIVPGITGFANEKSKYEYVLENFEEYSEGTRISDVFSEWIVKDSTDGDSITVEKDPITGGKAVRIKQKKQEITKNSNPYTGFTINFPAITKGKTEVRFSIRAESVTACFKPGFVYGSSGRAGTFYQLKSNFYLNSMSNSIGKMKNDEYMHYTLIYDLDNGIYTVTAKNSTYNTTKTVNATISDISRIEFLIAANFNDGAAEWIDNTDADAVYWIDDISVKQDGLMIENSVPAPGFLKADVSMPVIVSFNKTPADDSKDNISVFCNSQIVASDKYTLNTDGNSLIIVFVEAMEYGSDYRIEFSEELRAQETGILPLSERYVLNYHTRDLFEAPDGIEDGKNYSDFLMNFSSTAETEITATIGDEEGNIREYISGELISELGSYHITLTGVNKANGKTQTKEYNIKVVGQVAPYAEEVAISINTEHISPDSVLNCSYKYIDLNNDKEAGSILRWYSSNDKNGTERILEKEYILTDQPKNTTYELDPDDINRYFIFSVTPVSEKEPFVGEEVFSKPFAGFFEPEARNVRITGVPALGEKLFGEFDYYDENEQGGNNSSYQWYRSDEGGVSEKIANANDAEYILTENDANKILYFEVIPKKNGYEGKKVISEGLKSIMCPTAKNAVIKGTPHVGQIVYASYVFSDPNDDEEGNTQIVWYSDGEKMSTENSITLTKDQAGRRIYFEVMPVSKSYPFEGEWVRSNVLSVSDKAYSAGGGGGGASNYISPKLPEKEQNKINTDSMIRTPQEESIFKDIGSHWAKDVIEEMYKAGVISGVGNNEFRPDDPVTRAQFAMMINNIFGKENGENSNEFFDVDENDWFFNAVTSVAAQGFMSGYDGYFRPNDYITREEICVVIFNIAKLNGMTDDVEYKAVFQDGEKISGWAKNAVGYAYSRNIVEGRTMSGFYPKENATRAESLIILKRFHALGKKKGEADI